MTKKDYETIATALVMVPSHWFSDIKGYISVCLYMADELERKNPRFDRVKFLQACAVKPEDIQKYEL